MVLQIHYNNGAGLEGVRDSSGLRVYHQEPGGPEYVQAQQSTMNIYVPPRQSVEVSTTCTVQEEADLIAVWPHMHAIGSEFRQIVTRANGTVETIIGLTGWRFEAQLIYYTPKTLYPGDSLTTTCVWDNPYDRAVLWGTGSADEMCMSFMYVTPARANFCR
jgi:hypothetical protein